MLEGYGHRSLKSARSCPFCGGTTLGVFPGPPPRTLRRDTYRVLCGECQSAGPLGSSPDEAVARWNGNLKGGIRASFRV